MTEQEQIYRDLLLRIHALIESRKISDISEDMLVQIVVEIEDHINRNGGRL